jgi:CO/xanthine dehydrogenase Mo-binding subunit
VKFVGDRLRRKEDPRLLQGRGRYVGDIALPGMLHAAILRSPHAHARIGAIDVEQARAMAGVAAVLTFADLGAAARALPVIPPHPALRAKNFRLLAGDRVRFVGEAGFMDYALARSRDIPPLRIEHLETLSALNPLGLKGVGESGALPVPAVLASAIENALATRGTIIRQMPLMASTLHALIFSPPA